MPSGSADSGSAFTTRQVDGNYGLKLLLLPHPSKDNDNTKWDFIIDTIRLHGWKCNVSDLNTTPPTKLLFNNTSFTLEHFHKDTDEPSRMAVTTGMSPGATISINGTITNQPITANLTLDCKGISLPAFQSYVDKYSRLQILSGLLGLKGEMTYKDHGETAAKTFAASSTE